MTGVSSNPDGACPAPDLQAILEMQRRSFISDGPPSAAVRQSRIDRLLTLVLDNCDEFAEALVEDFGTRSKTASTFMEAYGIVAQIQHSRARLKDWMRPVKPMRAGRIFGVRAEIRPTPIGVVGIIGPWNIPVNLVALPAADAFAAGNRVMIKASEITPRTADILQRKAPEYFDQTELAVVTGGVDVSARFAALPLDHIFFTGSPQVGALVAQAAAPNLVPVTLELGGKNPVVISRAADIGVAAKRIAKGRLVNGGQTCICPEYVFVPAESMDDFAEALRHAFRAIAPTIEGNDDYCSSVNAANYERVVALIDDARHLGASIDVVAPSTEHLPNSVLRKIAPTIVRGVTDEMRIASEETFGPAICLLSYTHVDDVIRYVNARPAPLVAYWYGPDSTDFREFIRRTRSGSVARNDYGAQMIALSAPFGGVGRSGMGAYHGKAGFDNFSHYRTVVGTDLPFSITGIVAPPYPAAKRVAVRIAVASARRRAHRRIARNRTE
ncbi:aldehyde dehydrogenase family protein [Mycobacterium sp. WUMAC-067]|uniref:aldehyde dehydrogenase family protein n=1 Tax=unclassified Mycobacterium TaxID=2642494 RepID=UPI001CD92DFC|nr:MULTISPECIES: aldehyde dehydrogenase family protein [unclassified Mycobacterium]MCA2244774.1 aldehyde dehydrogenase family protein [Mycobacterium sp. WUMAC-067]MCA2315984.1 aldehyde dehydrogenase family protein [Mycobacterium sp. WUMAC-025]